MDERMHGLEGGDIPDFEKKLRQGRIRAKLDDKGGLLGYEETPEDQRGLKKREKKEKEPVDPNALAKDRLVEDLKTAEERMKRALGRHGNLQKNPMGHFTMRPGREDYESAVRQEQDIAKREVATSLKAFRVTKRALSELTAHGTAEAAIEALEEKEAETARALSVAEDEKEKALHRNRLEDLTDARGKLEKIEQALDDKET